MKMFIPWYLQIQGHCQAGFPYSACLAVLENFATTACENSGVREVRLVM
jgi:hypothetical protein